MSTTDFTIEEIQSVKDFIFNDEHYLNGQMRRFDPDYKMAQSWQRLTDGKPEKHDITMILHELYEMSLMDSGMSQEQAHIEASGKYNYKKEATEYYAKTKKHS